MAHLTDMELVDNANRGDATALESLFSEHYEAVYRLAYKWCGIKEDAEDVAQEVFIKVVRKLHTFGKRSSFKTWLYRITMNTAKDLSRRRAKRNYHESSLDDDRHRTNPDPAGSDGISGAQLIKEIQRLPAKQRESVLLVCGEGMSHREAAEILGCREKTVSWRIFQARKRLRIALEHESA